MTIPAWNAQGVLPPIGSPDPTSRVRSPYTVPRPAFVRRFGMSVERRAILDGLLQYRAALHAIGLDSGFQWLDGSFLEHVEALEDRAPNDIDVVTFFNLPLGETEASIAQQAPHLLAPTRREHQEIKAQFHVDAYPVGLHLSSDNIVRQSAYWYSMWSHRRNFAWKGFVQVSLAPAEDAAARAVLASSGAAGVQP